MARGRFAEALAAGSPLAWGLVIGIPVAAVAVTVLGQLGRRTSLADLVDEGGEFLLAFPTAGRDRVRAHLLEYVSRPGGVDRIGTEPLYGPPSYSHMFNLYTFGALQRRHHRKRINRAVRILFPRRRP